MAGSGFTDSGSTTHFTFEFDNSLDAPSARALSKALQDTCEGDYNTITSWFDGLTPSGVPFTVKNRPEANRPWREQ